MAVRTGLNTGLGSMVRELICPSSPSTQTNPFIQVRHASLGLLHTDLYTPMIVKHFGRQWQDHGASGCINESVPDLCDALTKAVHAGCCCIKLHQINSFLILCFGSAWYVNRQLCMQHVIRQLCMQHVTASRYIKNKVAPSDPS